MRRKSLWLIVVVAVMMASVCWTWWSVRSHDRANSRTLADGSVMRLKEGVFGRPLRVRTGNRWQDHLGMVLPEAWAKKLGAGFLTVGDSNRFAALLKVEWKQEYRSGPGGSYLRATTFDRHGCELGLATPDQSFSMLDGETIVFLFSEYPRREKMVGLRLYQRETNQTWKILAEFQVANPKPEAAPVWKAEAKPITQTVDGVEFTLLELKTGISARQAPPVPLKPGESVGVAIDFRLPPDGAWELTNFRGISDALGQTVGQGSYTSTRLRTGEYQVCVDGALCVEEGAWKVKAEFARGENFSSGETWMIRSIPAPKENETSLQETVTNIHGAELHFGGISGVSHPKEWERRPLGGQPVAHVICASMPVDLKLKLVRAVDERGRDALAGSYVANVPDYVFGLKIPPDAQTLDLTFVVTKPVAVSYLVKPGKYTAEELRKIREEW